MLSLIILLATLASIPVLLFWDPLPRNRYRIVELKNRKFVGQYQSCIFESWTDIASSECVLLSSTQERTKARIRSDEAYWRNQKKPRKIKRVIKIDQTVKDRYHELFQTAIKKDTE